MAITIFDNASMAVDIFPNTTFASAKLAIAVICVPFMFAAYQVAQSDADQVAQLGMFWALSFDAV